MSAASKFQQLSDAFLKISQGFAEVATIMNNNLEPVELRNEVLSTTEETMGMELSEGISPISVVTVQRPSSIKKVKKERDPNQPKKPLNNYFLFQRDFRARFKESHPTATSSELNKVMTETWENMSKEEAQYYDDLAKEHYSTYMKTLEEYKRKQEGDNSKEITITETPETTETTEIDMAINLNPSTEEPLKKKKKKNKEKQLE
jgi:hypothetical protein